MTAADLRGRSALVTGASRGIGLAVARALAGAGARVALLARGAEALQRVAGELGATPEGSPRALAVPCDLRDAAAIERAAAAVREAFSGPPDVLVNNAGVFHLAPLHEETAAGFAETIGANLVGPFALLRVFLPEWRKRAAGHVVTIGSVSDRVAYPDNGAYTASKFGSRALHEVARAELRGSGVRTTLISPGAVDTPIWDPIDPDGRRGFTPRARMLDAAAVADAVLWAVTRPPAVNIDELRLTRS
jgi:NADP-dependent 3-hydroxy acid dehydrogenase YdfG